MKLGINQQLHGATHLNCYLFELAENPLNDLHHPSIHMWTTYHCTYTGINTGLPTIAGSSGGGNRHVPVLQ
jgi:hypothetical protein